MKRAFSEALDNILGEKIPLLDKGYIIPVDYMGNENSIIESARVSYGEGTKSTNNPVNLMRILLRNRHTSPFECAEIKFEIKLPIFDMRQLVRHRTANLNEYSGRYSQMLNEYYIPEIENIAPQSITNKQGREKEGFSKKEAEYIQTLMRESCTDSFDIYESLLNEEGIQNDDFEKLTRQSLSRELARTVLPLSTYTKCVWKMDVHNLMHMISLRMDHHAQYEIRVYAEAMFKVLSAWMPNLAQAYVDYRQQSATFSRMEMEVLHNQKLHIEDMCEQLLAMPNVTKREVSEFRAKLIKEI